ncbi:MAG TPA: prepilin-type cleavage/methylation domain-containing protein [Burkholderiales bacterium]
MIVTAYSKFPERAIGFTLIELAIVLFILTLMLAGFLVPLATQVDQRNISDTQKNLNDIKEALIGFALANGRLPCPADPTIATGLANAGVERAICTGANVKGVLPWTTLGVNETDAWGRRYTYRVTPSFADAIPANTFTPPGGCAPTPPPTQSSFALCSQGDITVTDGSSNIATQIPAVIVSHGKNGYGAYTSLGTQLSTAGAGSDEITNANAGLTFVSRTYTDNPAATGGAFDDIVVWITPNILLNRMVAAGKLP